MSKHELVAGHAASDEGDYGVQVTVVEGAELLGVSIRQQLASDRSTNIHPVLRAGLKFVTDRLEEVLEASFGNAPFSHVYSLSRAGAPAGCVRDELVPAVAHRSQLRRAVKNCALAPMSRGGGQQPPLGRGRIGPSSGGRAPLSA
jgi:hypothetical protein